MKLVYSEEAAADLIRLKAFIAEQNPAAAARVAAELLACIENIRVFPAIGRSVPLAPEPNSVRDAVCGKYLVRYAAHAEAVVILRIWHHHESREQSA